MGSANAYVYWSVPGGDTIGRAGLDGSGPIQHFIAGVDPGEEATDSLSDVAVNNSHIYWAIQDINGPGAVARANIDGTGINRNLISVPGGQVVGVAIDGQHVYWAADNKIGRADLDGTNANPDFITGLDSVRGIAVNGSHIYWADVVSGSEKIKRADIDGTDVDHDFLNLGTIPRDVSLTPTHLYWTNAARAPIGTIGRSNLDGTGAIVHFMSIGVGGSRSVSSPTRGGSTGPTRGWGESPSATPRGG